MWTHTEVTSALYTPSLTGARRTAVNQNKTAVNQNKIAVNLNKTAVNHLRAHRPLSNLKVRGGIAVTGHMY